MAKAECGDGAKKRPPPPENFTPYEIQETTSTLKGALEKFTLPFLKRHHSKADIHSQKTHPED